MKDDDQIIRVFSGTEMLVLMLKSELEECGIGAMVQNDFQSGVMAGFVAGLPSSVDLYIREADLAAAEPVIEAFLQVNPD
ncbi:MAG: DUF2007 domain-containing protein [Bacteroidetes bacterium]|nr:DUF2007 domain-containing protein [Bacteroidota bacterium]